MLKLTFYNYFEDKLEKISNIELHLKASYNSTGGGMVKLEDLSIIINDREMTGNIEIYDENGVVIAQSQDNNTELEFFSWEQSRNEGYNIMCISCGKVKKLLKEIIIQEKGNPNNIEKKIKEKLYNDIKKFVKIVSKKIEKKIKLKL